ncbi:hypothetical protein ACWXVL_02300 [Mycoplasma sp. 128]
MIKIIKDYESKMKKRLIIWSFWFVSLNIIVLLVALVLSILSTLQIYSGSKLFGPNSWNDYLLYTNAITAITTFCTSIMSFFALRVKISKYQSRIEKLKVQWVLYEQKIGEYFSKDRDLKFYKNVCDICSMSWEIKYEEEK